MKNKQISIKNWAEDDRPREKLQKHGAKSLSDAELLAILIGSGSIEETAVTLCRRILSDMGNSLSNLARKNVSELIKYKGIGEAKAISIIAAMELVKRKKFDKNSKVKITSSKHIYQEVYSLLSDKINEEFWVIYMDRNNVIIDKKNISIGGVSSTIVDPKIIFKYALELVASSIILVHNHPSGNKYPGEIDKRLTQKIKEAAKVFDIDLLDHIIFAGEEYYSFADTGIL
jgi:DNA repair protein RadC